MKIEKKKKMKICKVLDVKKRKDEVDKFEYTDKRSIISHINEKKRCLFFFLIFILQNDRHLK